MIEVVFGIYGHDSIFGMNCASIAVNRLSRHPVSAGINDKRGCVFRSMWAGDSIRSGPPIPV
jgi:hypothetical protein